MFSRFSPPSGVALLSAIINFVHTMCLEDVKVADAPAVRLIPSCALAVIRKSSLFATPQDPSARLEVNAQLRDVHSDPTNRFNSQQLPSARAFSNRTFTPSSSSWSYFSSSPYKPYTPSPPSSPSLTGRSSWYLKKRNVPKSEETIPLISRHFNRCLSERSSRTTSY